MTLTPVSTTDAEALWLILREECGVSEDEIMHYQFVHWLSGDASGGEFRFMGAFGFGGKFRFYGRGMYVDYYPEDKAPDLDAIAARANERIKPYSDKYRAF